MEKSQGTMLAINQVLVKLDQLSMQVERNSRNSLSERWLDNQEACSALKISKHTLQAYRQKGILPFSRIRGKIYIRIKDIEDFLQWHYVHINHSKTATR